MTKTFGKSFTLILDQGKDCISVKVTSIAFTKESNEIKSLLTFNVKLEN